MKRMLGLVGAIGLTLGFLAPTVLADESLPHTGRFLMSVSGNVAIPAVEHADAVVVIDGHAQVNGEVNTLVVIGGSAELVGATIETVVAVDSDVEIGSGTVVLGELQRFDSTVHQSGNVDIRGGIVDMGARLFEMTGAMAAALMLLWIGFGLANVVAGLFLAAVAARQLRSATDLISKQPGLAFIAGLLGVVAIPMAAILLFPTVVGVPLGFGILIVGLPIVAFGGYLVAATWVGDWLLRSLGPRKERERPYLPMVIGVIVLGVLGILPVLGIVVAIASLFGFGAVLVVGIRAMSGGSRTVPGTPQVIAAPSGA